MALSSSPSTYPYAVPDDDCSMVEFPDTDDELGYPSYACRSTRLNTQSRHQTEVNGWMAPMLPPSIYASHPGVIGAAMTNQVIMGGMPVYGYWAMVPQPVSIWQPPATHEMNHGGSDGSEFGDDSEFDDSASEPGSLCSDCAHHIVNECKEPSLTEKREGVCTICLDGFTAGQSACLFPVCKHVFHRGCLLSWLKRHPKCPNCRLDLCELHVGELL